MLMMIHGNCMYKEDKQMFLLFVKSVKQLDNIIEEMSVLNCNTLGNPELQEKCHKNVFLIRC